MTHKNLYRVQPEQFRIGPPGISVLNQGLMKQVRRPPRANFETARPGRDIRILNRLWRSHEDWFIDLVIATKSRAAAPCSCTERQLDPTSRRPTIHYRNSGATHNGGKDSGEVSYATISLRFAGANQFRRRSVRSGIVTSEWRFSPRSFGLRGGDFSRVDRPGHHHHI